MVADIIAYVGPYPDIGYFWVFNHPCTGGTYNTGSPWSYWQLFDQTETVPNIVQNYGYLDGHVKRINARDLGRFEMGNYPNPIYFPQAKDWK